MSVHQSGRSLFPGTGFAWETGEGVASGSVVNVPLEPETGEGAWLAAVSPLIGELAAAFAPDVVVSQHGCDSHAWDPLANLSNTTTAMGAAARYVDAVAHRWAGGRWLATGGGGYGVYRVVPRAWALTWLAAAHRDVPERLPAGWRSRWADEAARFGDRSLPETFDDAPNAGLPMTASQAAADARSAEAAALARVIAVPRLVREAVDRGWWTPLDSVDATAPTDPTPAGRTEIIEIVDRATLEGLEIAPRVVAALDGASLRALLLAAPIDLTVAVDGATIVGLVASSIDDPAQPDGGRSILVIGVAPAWRRSGLATAMLRAHVAASTGPFRALVTLAERDPVEPLDRGLRATIARRLLEVAGFQVVASSVPIAQADPAAIEAIRR